jgi:hypothetical protein
MAECYTDLKNGEIENDSLFGGLDWSPMSSFDMTKTESANLAFVTILLWFLLHNQAKSTQAATKAMAMMTTVTSKMRVSEKIFVLTMECLECYVMGIWQNPGVQLVRHVIFCSDQNVRCRFFNEI